MVQVEVEKFVCAGKLGALRSRAPRGAHFRQVGQEQNEGRKQSDSDEYRNALAETVLQKFVPSGVSKMYDYDPEEVVLFIKRHFSMVVLQLDEYSANQKLTGALLRGCDDIFRSRQTKEDVFILPILSGILYATIREDLVKVSRKACADFLSLLGLQNGAMMRQNLRRELGIPLDAKIPNLDLITSTFGGFPRLYAWLLYSVPDKSRKNGFLSLDEAGLLYNAVVRDYQEKTVSIHFN